MIEEGILKLNSVETRYLDKFLEEMKNDFLDYCNSMGYSIDKEILDLKFKQLIHRIKNIINL